MKVIEFDNSKIGRFYVGICPSTKKVHYLATKESKCELAKAESFGISEEIEYIDEF